MRECYPNQTKFGIWFKAENLPKKTGVPSAMKWLRGHPFKGSLCFNSAFLTEEGLQRLVHFFFVFYDIMHELFVL